MSTKLPWYISRGPCHSGATVHTCTISTLVYSLFAMRACTDCVPRVAAILRYEHTAYQTHFALDMQDAQRCWDASCWNRSRHTSTGRRSFFSFHQVDALGPVSSAVLAWTTCISTFSYFVHNAYENELDASCTDGGARSSSVTNPRYPFLCECQRDQAGAYASRLDDRLGCQVYSRCSHA